MMVTYEHFNRFSYASYVSQNPVTVQLDNLKSENAMSVMRCQTSDTDWQPLH